MRHGPLRQRDRLRPSNHGMLFRTEQAQNVTCIMHIWLSRPVNRRIMVLPASCCAFKPRVFDPAIQDLLLPRSINEENMSKALPPSTSTCVEGMREDDGKRSKIAIEHRIFL